MSQESGQEAGIDNELSERALLTYVQVLAIGEPILLRLWDSRGLTITQLRLMHVLWQGDGVSVSRLAQSMDLSPSAMTGIIDRLVRSGLIRRKADRKDRRLVRIYLTPEGRSLLEEMDTAGKAYVNRIIHHLGRERVEPLVDSLSEFLEAAREVQAREVTS
ncbi:MAG: MarR family winged helix-turn-helix transcriptional regulator [Dehalococcoidia bacterium]